ncbi:head maturation protease, ClpP-related [Staphylococcus haemolyticus]|uniref:head maturation protease, ClpP-related n=1 Tax=Staphylococcus haemolyticus TaxID=1283 RepID=UPI0028FECCE0|nr:head maturation protease, ClpP-related [Staphylococcus haemolyticus]MDU0441538.1 Clp protease ClpP [Staphylococcus haemolyticus]MDU0473656.1 Clp protease ClpP [Staphylococcus haemolyticus]
MKIDRTKGFFNAKKESDTKAVMDIYGEIVDDKLTDSETSAVSFRDALKEFGDVKEIEITINSSGGSVFSGINIANQIANHPAHITVNVSGVAASIASVIAVAADTVKMESNSMMMIHEVWAPFMGNHSEMRKFADDLEKINTTVFNSYLNKNPDIDHAILKDMMAKETWLTSEECLELGLIDEITEANRVSAKISPEMEARFKNMPVLGGEKFMSRYRNEDPNQQPRETSDITVEDVMDKLEEILAEIKKVNDKDAKEYVKESEDKPAENSFARLFNMNIK